MKNIYTVKQSSQSGLQEIVTKCIHHWYIFLISVVICIALTYAFIYTIQPQYKISSTLLIQDDKNGSALGQTSAFSDLNMFKVVKTVDNEIEVLRSKDLLYKTLNDLSLETSYFVDKKFKKNELYGKNLPIIVQVVKLNNNAYSKDISIRYLNDIKFVLQDSLRKIVYNYNQIVVNKDYSFQISKGPAFSKDFPVIKIQFKNLKNLAESYNLVKLSIIPVVKDANTILLSTKDNVPERGVDVLTNLILNYNTQNVINKNITSINTIKFIDDRIKFLLGDLTVGEEDVESYKQKNKVTDVTMDAQQNAEKSNEYSQLLEAASVQIRLTMSIEHYFNNNRDPNSLAPNSLGLKDPLINSLLSRFNDLQLERVKLLRTAKVENPLVLNITAQLASLKHNILENLNNIKQGFIIERNNLKFNYSRFDLKVKAAPIIERGLLERSRQQGVKSGLYKYLLQKREETLLSLSATVATSQVIDRPAASSIPDSPKTDFLYLCGFIFGISIPIGLIYMNMILNNKVQDVNDIEDIGVKVLGEVSHNLNKGPVVFQNDRSSTISELFRYIRMNLGFLSTASDNKVLLVTSGMKGEGKTFFSLNLATTLSMRNKKVIILEFDLRRPDLLHKMGLDQVLGLSEFLNTDSIKLQDIIQPTKISTNLFVIGCGKIPDQPAETMLSNKMESLFNSLKEQFDYIILDTSPVGQVADAFSLASYADASIYLVRYNYTQKLQLGILKDIYENNKLINPMVVFNDSKRARSHIYGYAGYDYALTN